MQSLIEPDIGRGEQLCIALMIYKIQVGFKTAQYKIVEIRLKTHPQEAPGCLRGLSG